MMKLGNYKDKYIKYKNKYLEIKNTIQKGGMNCNNDRVFKNILGTCWMIVIQMMICFGDSTKNDIEIILKIEKSNIDTFLNELIESKKDEIENFFKKSFLDNKTKVNLLFDLLKTFYIRYTSKLGINKLDLKLYKDEDNPLRCERLINKNFKILFTFYQEKNKLINDKGGDLIEQFYFANILGIIFLNNKIFFKNFTRNNYTKIKFDPKKDIGLIITISRHVCCCFICNDEYKFYNDNDKKIYDFDWYSLLLNLNENEDLFIIPSGIIKLDRNEYFENIENYYLNYIRISFITVVSKNNFEDKFNEQISRYINDDYHETTDFYLLYETYLQTNDKKYLLDAVKEEYCFAQYSLGIITNNLKQLENAANNGSLYASYDLGLKNKESNIEDAVKYFLISCNKFFIKEKEVAKNLYEIYYNYYKNYKLALKFKLIYLKLEALKEINIINIFDEKKKLADEGYFDLQYDIGKIYLKKNDIDNAINYFNLAILSKEINLSAIAAYKLGKIYEEKKDIQQAIKYYNLAIQSRNIFISISASLKLGQIFCEKNELFQAELFFKKIIEKYLQYIKYFHTSSNYNIYHENILDITSNASLKLSEILINNIEEKEAISYLKIAIEKGSTDISTKAALKLGEILFNQNSYEDAAKYLEIAIKSDKFEMSAALLSRIYLHHYKNYRLGWNYKLMVIPDSGHRIKKLEDFKELKKLADEGFFDLQYDVGIKYLNEGNESEAIKYLNKSMGTKQKDLLAKVALKLGEILINQKSYEEAIKYLEIAIKSDKSEMAAALLSRIYLHHYKNYRLGWNYKLMVIPDSGHRIKKLEDFKELKKLADEGFFDLQYDVGIKYLNEGNESEAIKYLNKSMGTKQKDLLAKVALKLGEILFNQNKEDDAICYLNLAKENGTYIYMNM